MEESEKLYQELIESFLVRFTERIAQALAARDCAQADMAVPEKDHALWEAWNSGAQAVVEEMKRELMAFIDYEHTINWMTTCLACAKVLDSAYRETVRRELAEVTLKEVSEWAYTTCRVLAAGEVTEILEKGTYRQEKIMKGETDGSVADNTDR